MKSLFIPLSKNLIMLTNHYIFIFTVATSRQILWNKKKQQWKKQAGIFEKFYMFGLNSEIV